MPSNFPKAVSVVMRCFNEAWAVGDTIQALFDQDFAGDIELIVIDSGSTDGSVEKITAANPAKFIQIPKGTYVPGIVMNRGSAEASHEWIVYLNADATPVGKNWLTELIRPCLEIENFGAGFSRQVPRPDCRGVFAHDYDRCFGPQRESAAWDHFFSMVSSITRRAVLEAQPFREDLQYAEDDEWTRRLVVHGYQIVFCESSVAMHSHNYTSRQSYLRAMGDAKATAIAARQPPISRLNHPLILLSAFKDFIKDVSWCCRNGKPWEIPHAGATRYAQRLGKHTGIKMGSHLWQNTHPDNQ